MVADGPQGCMTALREDISQLIKKNEDLSAENIALGNAFADLAYDHQTLLDQKDEASDASDDATDASDDAYDDATDASDDASDGEDQMVETRVDWSSTAVQEGEPDSLKAGRCRSLLMMRCH